MNYSWNTTKWVKMYLSALLRKPVRIGVLVTIISAIKDTLGSASTAYADFIEFMNFANLRTRYTVQQASLQALLNKLFDPSLNRIYLVTTADLIATQYGSIASDTDVPIVFGKTAGEAIPTIYGYIAADYANAYDGYVYVPVALESREKEIKAWVDLNVFLSKTYKINYF